jgi:hypothetical protein
MLCLKEGKSELLSDEKLFLKHPIKAFKIDDRIRFFSVQLSERQTIDNSKRI